jgi:hypothetical protein
MTGDSIDTNRMAGNSISSGHFRTRRLLLISEPSGSVRVVMSCVGTMVPLSGGGVALSGTPLAPPEGDSQCRLMSDEGD